MKAPRKPLTEGAAPPADRFADILLMLDAIHTAKDRAYGNAWRKRGEILGIFANIARKVDRLEVAMTESSVSDVETRHDTVADLAIYVGKYLTWLAETHPDEFKSVRRSPSAHRCGSQRGPAALRTVLASLRAWGVANRRTPPSDANHGWAQVRDSFAVLEQGLIAQADRRAELSEDVAHRIALSWELLYESTWLLVRLIEAESADARQERHRSHRLELGVTTFGEDLTSQTLAAAVRGGHQQIALVGASAIALEVRHALIARGWGDRVVGVFDPAENPPDVPGGRPWAELAGVGSDLLVICVDAEKEDLLRAYVELTGGSSPAPEVVIAGMAHLDYRNPVFVELDAPALVPSYATGHPNTRIHLFQCLEAAAAAGINGAIVELGAFKGGTTAWLVRVATRFGLTGRVIAFDSWDGFPPRRALLDLYTHPRCEFKDESSVRRYLEPMGVEVVVGDIAETVPRVLRDVPVLLAFVDTDNYSGARSALQTIRPNLVAGGAIIFDHFWTTREYLYTIGERMAGSEVLAPPLLHVHGTGIFLNLHRRAGGRNEP